jgi:ribosomal protein S18 acetylase RimI-like enzyme
MAPGPHLARLARGMRAAAAARRTAFAVRGFALYLDLENPNPHLSVAVPDDDPPSDWGEGLADLRRLCAGHGRAARIEAFAELHPSLLEAADAAGWRRAMTAPVLTLAPADLAPPPPPVGDYGPLDPDDRPRLEAALRGAHEAYGGDPAEPAALDWLPGLSHGLRDGRLHAGAVDLAGRPVAGAVVMLGGDAGELAGVWTRPDLRRRGLARQACHALLTEAFEAGLPLAWLSAAEGALRLYEGLGFVRVGTQVNLEAP